MQSLGAEIKSMFEMDGQAGFGKFMCCISTPYLALGWFVCEFLPALFGGELD